MSSRNEFAVSHVDEKNGRDMVIRMKTEGATGGEVGRSKRGGLLLFALLLVVAQVALFVFLRMRNQAEPGPAVPSVSSSARPELRPSAATKSTDAPAPPFASAAPKARQALQAPQAPEAVGPAGPENQPLTRPGNEPEAHSDSSIPEGEQDGDKSDRARRRDREKHERERADREHERRDRLEAERERDQARERERERAHLEAEKDRARLEAEKDRARLEAERAEQARLEAERERARLEAERARLEAEKSTASATSATRASSVARAAVPVPVRPTGSPDVLVVVVSSRAGSSSLSREQIRNIYLGKMTFWPNDTPVRAYNRPASSPAGSKFFRSILGTSASAFHEHWNELQLSGGGIAPSTVSSAASVLARVAGSSGAIGYVLESELPADVSGVRLIRFK